MDWKEIAGTVAKSAPILGALLSATPAGAVISAAGALIGSVLGVEATPDAIGAQIAANPEALVKLREIEVAAVVHFGTSAGSARKDVLFAERRAP